jgi:hypothetical protein
MNCITSSAQKHQRHSITHHSINALSMSFNGQVKSSQHIISNRISSQLKYNSSRSILRHNLVHDSPKQLSIRIVINSNLKRYIYRVVFTFSLSNRIKTASSWEKLISILMKAHSHDSICKIEGLFDSISMMYIDINV